MSDQECNRLANDANALIDENRALRDQCRWAMERAKRFTPAHDKDALKYIEAWLAANRKEAR